MKKLTRTQFHNLVDSEENLYQNAINNLPRRDRAIFEDVRKKTIEKETEFLEKLKEIDPELVNMYMNIDDRLGTLIRIKQDAMYVYGAISEHVDLRILGWKAPERDIDEEDEAHEIRS